VNHIRIAAAGDIHCSEANRERVAAAFDDAERNADLILLAGDLTTHGAPEQAAVLGDICRGRDIPVVAVLGNHDWHLNRADEVVAELERGGICVLERGSTIREIRGARVGVAGTKGFIGGFSGSELPDFGEPLLREVYAEGSADRASPAGPRAARARARRHLSRGNRRRAGLQRGRSRHGAGLLDLRARGRNGDAR
jgi:Icc-related predicted phosphoesterase